jgi:hypothetical protein
VLKFLCSTILCIINWIFYFWYFSKQFIFDNDLLSTSLTKSRRGCLTSRLGTLWYLRAATGPCRPRSSGAHHSRTDRLSPTQKARPCWGLGSRSSQWIRSGCIRTCSYHGRRSRRTHEPHITSAGDRQRLEVGHLVERQHQQRHILEARS